MKEEQEFMNKYNSEKIQTWSNKYINYTLIRNEIFAIESKINDDLEQSMNSSAPNDETKNINQIQHINENNNNDNNDNKKNDNNKKIIKESIDRNYSSDSLSKKKDDVSMVSEEISIKINKNFEKDLSQTEKKFEKQIKFFINLLDKEINKMYIFYTTNEKDLFQGINSQIIRSKKLKKNKENFDIKELFSIIDSLEDISNLSKELINYVYLNIKALIRIINLFDSHINNTIPTVSYSYLQRYFSKQNSDLTYVLSLKILDQTSLATENLFLDLKKIIISYKIFNDPSNEKTETDFYNSEKNILGNISEINTIHNEIFSILTEWQNYLNIKLPSSTNNSIFRNTSIIGDSIPKKIKKSKKAKSKFNKKSSIKNDEYDEYKEYDIVNNNINKDINKNINKNDFNINTNKLKKKETENKKVNIIIENDENNEENDSEEEEIVFKKNNDLSIEDLNEDRDLILIGSNINVGSNLFDPVDTFRFTTGKILNKSNMKNLRLLFPLVGFYSYSYSMIIPKIIFLLYDEKNPDEIFYYALVISIPSFGNLISQIYMPKLSRRHYKSILLTSLFSILIYYILLVYGIKNKKVLYTLIGRTILGLSYLKQLSKIYVDNYVPITNQIQSNRQYALWTNIGFLFGFGINVINTKNFEIIFYISGGIFLIMLILVIIIFNEPSEENINELNNKFTGDLNQPFSNEAEIYEKLVDEKNEKENINNNLNLNNSISNSESELDSYVSDIENTKKFYFKKIFFILLFLLIANQYASENILLLFPRFIAFVLIQEENKTTFWKNFIITIAIPIIFLLSYFIQTKCLKKNFIKTNGKCLLMTFSFLIIIFNAFFGYLILPGYFPRIEEEDKFFIFNKNEIFQVYLPFIGVILLIILTELFHMITVNMFIELLPSEDLKFCCFKMSSIITIITKLTRIVPSVIITIITFKDDIITDLILSSHFADYNDKDKPFNLFNLTLFSFQTFNYFICFIVCLCSSKLLKRGFMNRILAEKTKDTKT